MGRVIVKALNTAPIITKTQIEINTATVISLVNAAVASAFLFGCYTQELSSQDIHPSKAWEQKHRLLDLVELNVVLLMEIEVVFLIHLVV